MRRLETTIAAELAERDAVAVGHAGRRRDPDLRYCLSAADRDARCRRSATDRDGVVAVAYDGEGWLVRAADGRAHPADRLATDLADRAGTGRLLTPARLPHDAALFLEREGFDLASTDVLERARATKTDAQRRQVADAQAAAGAGLRRAASLLAEARVADERLAAGADPVTPDRLRRVVDGAVVGAGAFPAGTTVVSGPGRSPNGERALLPDEPIVVATAPRGPDGYHGGLARTFVVDGEGGRERRAHVAVTRSLRSARSLLAAGDASVGAVEADLAAEGRAFGFEADAVEARAFGVGLEPRERPLGDDAVEPGSVVRLESAVRVGDGWVRIADLVATDGDGATWLAAPSRSLDPASTLEAEA